MGTEPRPFVLITHWHGSCAHFCPCPETLQRLNLKAKNELISGRNSQGSPVFRLGLSLALWPDSQCGLGANTEQEEADT